MLRFLVLHLLLDVQVQLPFTEEVHQDDNFGGPRVVVHHPHHQQRTLKGIVLVRLVLLKDAGVLFKCWQHTEQHFPNGESVNRWQAELSAEVRQLLQVYRLLAEQYF
uniref:Putative secreted protein n=1 Tax=Ixodes ricinus TaxID=34613 RepID=A0A6B0UDV9_IXORI